MMGGWINGMDFGGYAGFNRGERYSALAAMSVNGYVATPILVCSVDSQEFLDFMRRWLGLEKGL